MNLLSLSCPKQKATCQYSLTLRQSEFNKFVVSKYYHPFPETGCRGSYGNGEYFGDLADAIAEFREQAKENLDQYRSYPEIMEVELGSLLGSSLLFEFKMEVLARTSYQPIYLIEMNGAANDRPLQFFAVSTETVNFFVGEWDRAIVSFSSEINNCLSRVTLNLAKEKGVH